MPTHPRVQAIPREGYTLLAVDTKERRTMAGFHPPKDGLRAYAQVTVFRDYTDRAIFTVIYRGGGA